jgi:hypothetical protein
MPTDGGKDWNGGGGLKDWSPYKRHVQGGLKDGDFANGQFVLLCAGPPHMSFFNNAEGDDIVYPIGLTQNLALSHNRVFSRIFEIGSERSYFIPGRTVGQLTLSRVYYHGPSLLRCLWAYYKDTKGDAPDINEVFGDFDFTDIGPYDSAGGVLGALHDVQIPPGFDNVFLNLASDLFSQPIGLLLILRDSEEQNLAACYLEQCYVPTHTWATDSQGLIIQESVGIQFERLVPLKTSAVHLIKGIFAGSQEDGAAGATSLGLA